MTERMGFDDIGGVKTTAHANFEDGDFLRGCGEAVEGHGGDGFKKAGQMRQRGSGDKAARRRR